MDNGNWIPISKALCIFLPRGRIYTEIEAAYSLQLDYDQGNTITIAGLSKIWGWSRKRVRTFLERMQIEIIYPESTEKKQNQRGQIGLQIGDRSGTDRGQIRLINSNNLNDFRNRKGTDKGQIRDRSGNTTKDPNTNPNKEEKNNAPFQALKFLKNNGAEESIAKDWLKVRKTKRLANTERAFNTIISEINKTGRDINFILGICIDKSWGGFNRDWPWQGKQEQEKKSLLTPEERKVVNERLKNL